MAGPTRDDDSDDASGFDDTDDGGGRPRVARRRSAPDSVPSLDDADAVQSLPDGAADASDVDGIPSLDDIAAVTSVSGEGADEASSFASGATLAERRALDTRIVDERQVNTQIVARPRGLVVDPADDRAGVAPIDRAAVPPARARRGGLVAAVTVVVVVAGVAAVVALAPHAGIRRASAPATTALPSPPPAASAPTSAPTFASNAGADQALAALRAAVAEGDLKAARALVAASVWPVAQPSPPASLTRGLASPALARASHAWVPLTGGAVRLDWSEDAAFAGLGKRYALTLAPVDGHLQATAWMSEGVDDAAAVGALLVFARAAVDERDGARLLALVKPGPGTCDRTTCGLVKRAVVDKKPHPLVDAVTLSGIVEGSLRAMPERSAGGADEAVRLRYLRRTRAYSQLGAVELVVAPSDGAWRFVAVDTTHVAALEHELSVWQVEHAMLAWRSEVAGLVELTALPVTCERKILAWCASEIAPTRVKNLGRVAIRRLQVTKVIAGQPAASPWGIWNDIAPGAAADKPVRTSPAPAGKGFLELRTFDAYRVDWIELEGGRRLAPGAGPVPDDLAVLEAARRKAHADTAALASLRSRLTSLGYTDDELARLSAASPK